MVQIRFTKNIQRHVKCPPETVAGETVRQALDAYFTKHPAARDYVVDEQHALRRHMVIFVQGKPIRDRTGLTDAVEENSTVDVMQALSGG